jgi:hypothetical protein
MASDIAVMEDSFEFTPVVLVMAFHVCCEEGDGCLNILTSSFAKEE